MIDCLRTDKRFPYITNTKVSSAFHPSGVDKSSIGISVWGYGGALLLVSDG